MSFISKIIKILKPDKGKPVPESQGNLSPGIANDRVVSDSVATAPETLLRNQSSQTDTSPVEVARTSEANQDEKKTVSETPGQPESTSTKAEAGSDEGSLKKEAIENKPVDSTAQGGPAEETNVKSEEKCKKVFVIESCKDLMAKDCLEFLRKLGFETVSVHYQEKDKRSLEQHLQEHKDVTFAVVMLAGEDFAYPKDGKPKEAKLQVSQRTVFELGYLDAELGRQNTFVLYYEQSNFRLPTDIMNLAYISYNPRGDWRKSLLQHLRMCGFAIDEKIDYLRGYL